MPPRPASQRVRLFTEADPLVLSSGRRLNQVEVAFETYGELSPAADNAVFVGHALTGDAHAADWWETMVGPGKPVDTDRFFVISPNILGGCNGTTGPRSIDPETGRRHGLDFPMLSMGDLVAVHRRLVGHLGVRRLHAAIGGSLGGMQVLQWLIEAPEEIGRAVMIGASSRLSAQNIAFSAVARASITGDPEFRDGDYEDGAGPRQGMAIARQMAHITYVSAESLERRFGRRLQFETPRPGFGVDFAVESYLDHQGQRFLERFDALTYLYFTRVMDYFDPFPDDGTDHSGASPSGAELSGSEALVLSFNSDWRFDTSQSERIAECLRDRGARVDFAEIESSWGHDSFLLEIEGYQRRVAGYLRA